jgi:NAD(P)-dependent dehydrogenase (short-subunit alcohol dehydrogenase family)
MDNFRLDGKQAVITGGASGIGLAIAEQFSYAGAKVVIFDLNAESAEKAAAAVAGKTSAPVSSIACDVSDEASVQAAFASIPGGRIDILVNSAGVAHVGTLLDTSASDFDRLYRVNVRGTYLCMQAAVQVMAEQHSGVILNLASIAATAGLSQRFAYSMTKGAVLSMTLSVAKDYLASGIRCNCVSPARVHTPFVDGFLAKNYPGREAEMMKTLAASQPIGRMGTPEEIALLALYLCSDAASFITGSDVPIDGGFATLR